MTEDSIPQRFGSGRPVRRTEDVALVKGKGRFVEAARRAHRAGAARRVARRDPVFPPDRNAADVLAWLARGARRWGASRDPAIGRVLWLRP